MASSSSVPTVHTVRQPLLGGMASSSSAPTVSAFAMPPMPPCRHAAMPGRRHARTPPSRHARTPPCQDDADRRRHAAMPSHATVQAPFAFLPRPLPPRLVDLMNKYGLDAVAVGDPPTVVTGNGEKTDYVEVTGKSPKYPLMNSLSRSSSAQGGVKLIVTSIPGGTATFCFNQPLTTNLAILRNILDSAVDRGGKAVDHGAKTQSSGAWSALVPSREKTDAAETDRCSRCRPPMPADAAWEKTSCFTIPGAALGSGGKYLVKNINVKYTDGAYYQHQVAAHQVAGICRWQLENKHLYSDGIPPADVQAEMAKQTASHLCHKSACFDWFHINMEPGAKNTGRNGCPFECKFCGEFLCVHKPPCLRRNDNDNNC
jgi:hypothetical protein